MRTCEMCKKEKEEKRFYYSHHVWCQTCHDELEEEEMLQECYECLEDSIQIEMKKVGNKLHCKKCYEKYETEVIPCDECKRDIRKKDGYYRMDVMHHTHDTEGCFGIVCEDCNQRKGNEIPTKGIQELSEMVAVLYERENEKE